jgi:hypothetical protein
MIIDILDQFQIGLIILITILSIGYRIRGKPIAVLVYMFAIEYAYHVATADDYSSYKLNDSIISRHSRHIQFIVPEYFVSYIGPIKSGIFNFETIVKLILWMIVVIVGEIYLKSVRLVYVLLVIKQNNLYMFYAACTTLICINCSSVFSKIYGNKQDSVETKPKIVVNRMTPSHIDC